MLSLENDVGPFLAMCVATQYYGDIILHFEGNKGITEVEDKVSMRRLDEIQRRIRHMAGPRPVPLKGAPT